MNLAQFVKDNLVGGYQNGNFTIEQVNIFSLNYLTRGIINQADFDEIQAAVNPKEISGAN